MNNAKKKSISPRRYKYWNVLGHKTMNFKRKILNIYKFQWLKLGYRKQQQKSFTKQSKQWLRYINQATLNTVAQQKQVSPPPPSPRKWPVTWHTICVIGAHTQHHHGAAKVLPGGGYIVQGHPKEVHTQIHIIGQVTFLIIKVLEDAIPKTNYLRCSVLGKGDDTNRI